MRKKIRQIIEEAPEAEAARSVLEAMRIFGDVTEEEYKKAQELIRKEFKK